MPKSLERNIILCNGASLILVLISFVFGFIYFLFYGFEFTTGFILVATFFFSLPILMNAVALTALSRLTLSLLLPILTILASLSSKYLSSTTIEETGYFDYRFILLVACVFPVIYTNISERILLVVSLLGGFLCLAFFDPIHNLFGYGYYQMGQDDTTYYFTNVVAIFSNALLLAAVIILRRYFEKFEHENQELVKILNDNNRELAEKNDEISTQHEELIAQNEEIISQHEQLGEQAEEISKRNAELNEAKLIIQQQNNLLTTENQELTSELVEKSQHLEETNTELIKHNNELQQFSYAVSHNLRGPVASLLGLINIFKRDDLTQDNRKIFDFVDQAAHHLDQIITDLSKIVDIRHSIFQIRQRIVWSDEINHVTTHLKDQIEASKISVTTEFNNCEDVFSVRPLVHSILYNLITNAIKYSSESRLPKIEITTSQDESFYYLTVRDNGLGIDLELHKNSLFKLYKRFHLHSEGKGLGLYLTKLQVESLGGTISVKSKVNEFTEFSVTIKRPTNLSRQIIFEEAHAKFFFNAQYDACGLVWSGLISSEQYRTTMTRCLELLRVYNTPNWISDAADRGSVGPEELEWLINDIVTPAAKNGLRRICFIRKDANESSTIQFVEGLRMQLPSFKIELGVFDTFQNALNWVQEKNQSD